MTGPRHKAGGEPLLAKLVTIFGLARDRLLVSGWVVGYAIILAIFQLVKQLESILRKQATLTIHER